MLLVEGTAEEAVLPSGEKGKHHGSKLTCNLSSQTDVAGLPAQDTWNPSSLQLVSKFKVRRISCSVFGKFGKN